jgi:hypothetical protein
MTTPGVAHSIAKPLVRQDLVERAAQRLGIVRIDQSAGRSDRCATGVVVASAAGYIENSLGYIDFACTRDERACRKRCFAGGLSAKSESRSIRDCEGALLRADPG